MLLILKSIFSNYLLHALEGVRLRSIEFTGEIELDQVRKDLIKLDIQVRLQELGQVVLES